MNICCVCLNFIDVNIEDFGITYVVCNKCGREYEVFSEFSLASDIDEKE